MGEEGEELSMKALFEDIREIKLMNQESRVSDEKINRKLDEINNKFQPLTETVAQHSKEIKYLDQDKRRKNLIVFGLEEHMQESRHDLETKVLNLIVNNLDVAEFTLLELDFCRRLGNHSTKARPVLLAVTTQRRRFEILRNRGKLKDSNIFIREDSSPEDRKQEKELLAEMLRLRKEGKYAVLRSGKLIVRDRIDTNKTSGNNKRALSESPKEEDYKNKRVNLNASSSDSDILMASSDSITPEADEGNNVYVQQTGNTSKDNTPSHSFQLNPTPVQHSLMKGNKERRSSSLPRSSQPRIENFFQSEDQNPKNP